MGELFRQVQLAIEQYLKTGRRVAEVNSHHAIVDFAAIAVILPADAHRVVAALGRARLVHTADGFRVRMIVDDDLLAAIAEFLFIPLDGFEESLQCPGCGLEV